MNIHFNSFTQLIQYLPRPEGNWDDSHPRALTCSLVYHLLLISSCVLLVYMHSICVVCNPMNQIHTEIETREQASHKLIHLAIGECDRCAFFTVFQSTACRSKQGNSCTNFYFK